MNTNHPAAALLTEQRARYEKSIRLLQAQAAGVEAKIQQLSAKVEAINEAMAAIQRTEVE